MANVTFNKAILMAGVERNIRSSLVEIGQNLVDEIKGIMQPGSGNVYIRLPGPRIHRASIAGEPPAPDYWRLKDSITYKTTFGDGNEMGSNDPGGSESTPSDAINSPRKTPNQYAVSVGTNVDYALELELGIGMAARPYLARTLAGSTDMIIDAFSKISETVE